jgi:sulfur carrier protein ThiS
MIRLEVRLFTILRHRPDGQIRGRLSLELQGGSTVADVLRELDVPDDLPIVISVNEEQSDPSTVLHDGDRVELIPAVAGGSERLQPVLSPVEGLLTQTSLLSLAPLVLCSLCPLDWLAPWQISCYNATNTR